MPTTKTIQEWIEYVEEIESSCENGEDVYNKKLIEESEYNELKEENERLKQELEDIKDKINLLMLKARSGNGLKELDK